MSARRHCSRVVGAETPGQVVMVSSPISVLVHFSPPGSRLHMTSAQVASQREPGSKETVPPTSLHRVGTQDPLMQDLLEGQRLPQLPQFV